jgi:hypothetical protein
MSRRQVPTNPFAFATAVLIFTGGVSNAIEIKFAGGYPKEDPPGSVIVKVDIQLGIGERLKSYTVEISPIDPADNPKYSNKGDLEERATSISNTLSPVKRGRYKITVTIVYLDAFGQEKTKSIVTELTVNGP